MTKLETTIKNMIDPYSVHGGPDILVIIYLDIDNPDITVGIDVYTYKDDEIQSVDTAPEDFSTSTGNIEDWLKHIYIHNHIQEYSIQLA